MRLKTDYHLLRRTDICQIQFKQSYSTRTKHAFDTDLAATSWFEVGPKYGIHVDGNFLRGIRGCKPDKVKQVCTQQFGEEAMKDYDRFREEKRQYSYRWIAEHVSR